MTSDIFPRIILGGMVVLAWVGIFWVVAREWSIILNRHIEEDFDDTIKVFKR